MIYITIHKEICLLSYIYSYFCKINAISTYLSSNEPKKWGLPQLLSKYKKQYHKDLWYMTEQWPRDKIHLLHMTSWRNGSASDSRSEGCVFESRRGQFVFLFCFYIIQLWPIDCFGFHAVSLIFQPCYGGYTILSINYIMFIMIHIA